jgi:3-carboxy-cis,cis-muconate cycloisomerase
VLGLSGGLIVAEAVMMGLAPALGRQVAHDVVHDCCRAALARGKILLEAPGADPRVAGNLDREALEALVDPTNYLGAGPR